MEKILFSDVIKKYFPVLQQLVQYYNDERKAPTYLFKQMLTPRFSVNQTWESSAIHNSIVAADVVSMDSNLPLKRRDSLKAATGELNKIGMKMELKETQINEIELMIAKGGKMAEVTRQIMNDAIRCTNGVDERAEFLFLQALSNGFCVVADDYNTGEGVRVNFGYKDENKFDVTTPWTDSVNSTPISDLTNVINRAADKGDIITTVMMTSEAFQNLRKSREAKELVASGRGIPVLPTSKLQLPTRTNMLEAIRDEMGVSIIFVDRTVLIEKSGDQIPVKPWNKDKIIFLTGTNVGEFVYGQLVEEGNPAEGVVYTKPNEYTLIKRWHCPEPFAEWTSSQALALPVLQNVHTIYQLDITAEE